MQQQDSILSLVTSSMSVIYPIMCVFACVCVLHSKTKKTNMKYDIESVNIFVVVEIHSKTPFHFHSSVHSLAMPAFP